MFYLNLGEELSNDLRKASLQTMPLNECNTTLLKYFPDRPAFQNGIDQSQYCAHDPIGKRDSCQGDSGGPLQLIQEDAELAQVVGIVSFGISCGTRLPSIYTRVAFYLDWIESHVWPNGVISIPNFILILD